MVSTLGWRSFLSLGTFERDDGVMTSLINLLNSKGKSQPQGEPVDRIHTSLPAISHDHDLSGESILCRISKLG